MFILTRKSLVSFANHSVLEKSYVSFYMYFSTSKGNQKLVTNPTVSEFLTQKHNLSPQAASRVASALTHLRNPENSDSIISFLKENGFSNTQLNKMLESRPRLLVSSLDKTIKPKFEFFKDFGFSESQIAKLLSKDSWIMEYSLENRVVPSLSLLKGLLGSSDSVAKLLMLFSWFLTKDLEKSVVPNIEFLVSCGVPMKQILQVIYRYPRFLLVKPESMRRCAIEVCELGIEKGSITFLQAVRVFCSITDETWELKLQAFGKLGFSEGDTLAIFKKAPHVFGISVEKIKKITEVLLATGKYDLSCILKNPNALTCSFEKRYKPRLQVLQILESKNLIRKWPCFYVVYLESDKKFFKKFVEPFSNEVSEVDMAKNVLCSKKRSDVVNK